MSDYFEHAFEGLCNSLGNLRYLGEVLLVALIYLTVPIWSIPYWLLFKRERKNA